MTQGKRAAVEVEREVEDIITALPVNVVDRILKLLPVHDAAKTSILSRKWRGIWASHPYLVLNSLFCKRLITKSESFFRETVDMILLQHIGDIVEFDLDVSGVRLSSFIDIDRWMLFVTRNGVKKLTLKMSKTINTTYKVPSYIFNCRTLEHLTLFNCIFKPPNPFLGFNNLITLCLRRITFVPATEFCVINAPILINLTLIRCKCTQYFNIVVSSRLKCLSNCGGHGNLDLNRFANCKELTNLVLLDDSPIHSDEISTYEKLIFSLSALEKLTLGPIALEVRI
uniref:Ubiquitin-protein ligase n=2 Tax=Solanum tuberosum TaxID=4113 RepID=M1D714_SOLTU